jgi:hypothetical protein
MRWVPLALPAGAHKCSAYQAPNGSDSGGCAVAYFAMHRRNHPRSSSGGRYVRDNEFQIRRYGMLELHKSTLLDENQNPVAVQIPFDEFKRIEEVIENYGLAKLMDEVGDDEQLSVQEAKHFYGSLKQDVET